MKKATIHLLLFLFLPPLLKAQNRTSFLRLYNSSGKKIGKGEILETTDTTIVLTKGTTYIAIPATQIEVIKSKRTTAHRITITTLKVIGGAALLVALVYSTLHRPNDNYQKEPNKKYGNKTAVNNIPKRPRPLKKYKINSDLEKWQAQRTLLNQLL